MSFLVMFCIFLLFSCTTDPELSPKSESGTFIDDRDGKTYKWVKIGTQTWMAENLNYNANGSKCGNDSSLSDATTSTCDTYGRLYNWATAMALDSTYNFTLYSGSEKRQGVCPAGWHLPSNAEWTTLINFGGSSSKAGTKLKATNGWDSHSGTPAGTDDYGFAALPGGNGFSDGSFRYVGEFGIWWTSSGYSANLAYNQGIRYDFESAGGISNDYKSSLSSIRCLQDLPENPNSSSSSSIVIQSGTFTDNRDDKTYKWVKIGSQTWMAENLNYNATGSKCGNGNNLSDATTSTCDTYGRLYNWDTAMDGVCPSGWHIPKDAEWGALMKFINPNCNLVASCTGAGAKLKIASGWTLYNTSGTNDYGFAALPSGYGFSNGMFWGLGASAHWWSASEYDASAAYYREVEYMNDYIGYGSEYKSFLFSIRCLKD
jgi:uncharacterized protein (TIGR02145 family)